MEWWHIVLWIVLLLFTIVLEFVTFDLVTIWFSIGAVGSLIAAALGASLLVQTIVFLSISILLLIATRPIAKKFMKREIIKTNADKIIGLQGVVTKDVFPNEIGEIKVDNALWRAIGQDKETYLVGEVVNVNSISGTKAIITKIRNNKELEIL